MKRIIVIGCSGSGKSYFSSKLSNILNIEKYHLDCYYWKENWQATPREEFVKVVDELLDLENWIIDGNYSYTMERRMIKADTIFFLDLPTDVCLESERKRRGNKREDLPSYLVETKEDDGLEEFIKNFHLDKRNQILSLLDKYSYKNIIIFKSREEVDNYLIDLERKTQH